MAERMVTLERSTNETQIELTLDLDGTGRYEIDTGCGFLNHMLELFARHGRFDLVLTCHGDVQVDYHHTTEDVGDFDVECAKEFWYGFARSVPATVHFVQFAGENTHHILEACFKGAGHALAEAVRIDAAHRDEIPSTKGLLV